MLDLPVDRYWIDSSAIVGDGTAPVLDFRRAVHLTIYWGQDLSNGQVCTPAHPPKRLAEQQRRGFPLSDEETKSLGEGRWPLPAEAFEFSNLPWNVDEAPLKKGGTTSWHLTESSLHLRKSTPVTGCLYVGETLIESGPPVRIRQRVMHVGPRGPIPGVLQNMKLISSVCGLYDGGVRMLPLAREVRTEEDGERFAGLLESDLRQQPVMAVACTRGETEERWRADVASYAREAFTLQHVAAVTVGGVSYLDEILGSHALPEGAIKIYGPGFTPLDIPQTHPVTTYHSAIAHEGGRKGMLNRLRIRRMTQDAWERRGQRR